VRARRTDLAALTPPASLSGAQAQRLRSAVDDAFVHGFRIVMLAMAGLAVAAAGVGYGTLGSFDPTADEGG